MIKLKQPLIINIPIRVLITTLLWLVARETFATSVITNVTVIDAVNGIKTAQNVLFKEDEIVAVQAANIPYSATKQIDGKDKFLIPGLWDNHVHMTYDKRFTDIMPTLFLSYGVTSVRDTGGIMSQIKPVVDKLRAPGFIGPRIFFSGPLLDGHNPVYDGIEKKKLGIPNRTVDEAKKNVALLKEQGVDFIKIYEMVSPEVFTALVDAANEHNLPIDSHVPLSMKASVAGASVDSMQHLRNVEMDCTDNAEQLLKERLDILQSNSEDPGFILRSSLHRLQQKKAIENYSEAHCNKTLTALSSTQQVPTLRLNGFLRYQPFLRKDWKTSLDVLPEAVRQEWGYLEKELSKYPVSALEGELALANWSLFMTGLMHSANIPIAAGTDTPIGFGIPGYSLHSELEMLVRAGMSPLEALRAATVRGAEFFSLDEKLGTIEAGKKADMVLLSKNPLEDITHTREIVGVISKGMYRSADTLAELIETHQE